MNKRQIEKRISLIPENLLNSSNIIDPEYLFLIKKTEKIVTATYILSDFIPNEEILKKTLKDNSHELLDNVCELLYNRTDRLLCVQKNKASFIKLATQFNIAEIMGFVSKMNAEIIKSEINILIKMIDDFERELMDEQSTDFKQNYFYVDTRIKRTYTHENINVPDKVHPKRQIPNPKSQIPKASKLNTDNTDDRANKVLSIIKDNGVVSIKDISVHILDCSEKTIQRTLNKLIDEGKIQKTGERRWAKYSV